MRRVLTIVLLLPVLWEGVIAQSIADAQLSVHWKLTDPVENQVTDVSGNGRNGWLPVPGFMTNGTMGEVLRFDGMLTRVIADDGSHFKFEGGEATICIWVNSEDDDGGRLVSKPWNGGGEYNYALEITPSNALRLVLMEGTHDFNVITRPGSIIPGRWTHVAVTVDNQYARIYINGEVEKIHELYVDAWVPRRGDHGVPLTIGCLYPYPRSWTGSSPNCLRGALRDFRVYERRLSESEVGALISETDKDLPHPVIVLPQTDEDRPLSGVIGFEVHVQAHERVPVKEVEFLVDGVVDNRLRCDIPPLCRWDTSTVTDGKHTIGVRAVYNDGTASLSNVEIVTVRNDSKGRFKTTYPRIATAHAVNQFFERYIDPLYRVDLAILGFDKGWRHGALTENEIVEAIRRKNPRILIGQYSLLNEVMIPYHDPRVLADVYRKIESERGPKGVGNWWARTADGEYIGVYRNSRSINITANVTPDSKGRTYPEWLAEREFAAHFIGEARRDVWFVDNVVHEPYIDADWNGDGVADSKADQRVRKEYREAFERYVNAIRRLDPTVMIMANAGDDHPDGFLNAAEYIGRFEMGFFENVQKASWRTFMEGYRQLTRNTTFPHIVVVSMYGSPSDYAEARYGLAATLMGDGYYYFGFDTAKLSADRYTPVIWMDEYDQGGTASTEWLGKAVDPPQSRPWKEGVYRRRFENGMALVNPKGGETKMITVEPGYRHIEGKQTPNVNNGAPVSSVVLNGGEGLLLVKK